jgi:hypothetical protein
MSGIKYGIGVPHLAQKMFKELNVHPPFPQLSFFPFVQPTIDILRSLEIPYFDEVVLLNSDLTSSDVGKLLSTGIIIPEGYVLIVSSIETVNFSAYHSGSRYDVTVYDQNGFGICNFPGSLLWFGGIGGSSTVQYLRADAYGLILLSGTELNLKLQTYSANVNSSQGIIFRVSGKLQFVGGLLDELKKF